MVAVSGAFHTSRMDPAAAALKQVMAEARVRRSWAGVRSADVPVPHAQQVTFNEPRIPVYSNVTGAPFPNAAAIPELLARQLVEPVQWEGSVKVRLMRAVSSAAAPPLTRIILHPYPQAMISAGKKELFELGPGAQIKAMVKRIDGAVWKDVKNVQP